VGAAGREARAPGEVVLEDGGEGGLVADVGDVLVVEIIEARDEGGGAAEEGDEGGLVVGDVASREGRYILGWEERGRGADKLYSQMLDSYVSPPVAVSEQPVWPSRKLQLRGSW
jgi:hypothetical protein